MHNTQCTILRTNGSTALYLNVWWITKFSTWSTSKWYIVVDHPCVELFFWKPATKFNCTIREGAIVFTNVLNSKRQSYQCLQNKNPLSGCKVSTFFSLCPCLLMPPFQPLHFIGECNALYYNNTTFVWCVGSGDHFVSGGADQLRPVSSGDLPPPHTQWSPHTDHQTLVVLL